jgi:hypothetical protein
LKPLNALFFVAFCLSVAVQYNDPDPWSWSLLYGVAAGSCLAWQQGKLPWQISALIASVALLWTLWLLPQFVGKVEVADIFASLSMKTKDVEEAREAGGALLVFLWMTVLSVRSLRSLQRVNAAP